jgi:hypothetical protein
MMPGIERGAIDKGPVVIAAVIALIVLVMALAGSKLEQRAVITMVGVVAAALLAIWLFSPGIKVTPSRDV